MNTRGSGILLHISSLPGRFGIGDLGPAAYEFADFLRKAGQRYWQILPIHPTDLQYDNSPYHALSAFAGNPLLISPDLLVADGFLDSSDLDPAPQFPEEFVDFPAVTAYKERLFDIAYNRFIYFGSDPAFKQFCEENAWWLDEYSLFSAIRKHHPDLLWSEWPDPLKFQDKEQIEEWKIKHASDIGCCQFLQYLFSLQWNAFRKKCHESGIWIIGDIPIYVDYDSSDVWMHPSLFQLDENLMRIAIAGVPPDYFSSTGQVWNNPLYDWDEMKKTGFEWWIRRMKHLICHVDYVRIDHFRGLVGYWKIPAGEQTAINGRWVPAPAWDLLTRVVREFPYLPVIAEDLGIITPEVREVMRGFSIPGMKVLVFAFSSNLADSPYVLHNITPDSIVYTGTHDNNPTRGWFESEASEMDKANLFTYLGREVSAPEICQTLIRMAMMSIANTAIIPMQDWLDLGVSARMNIPGVDENNWKWRMRAESCSQELAGGILRMTETYGR